VTINRPDDWLPMARAASVSRTVRGWVSGVLTPNLNSNSAVAPAGAVNLVVAKAPEAAPSRALRVIFMGLPPARMVAPTGSFRRTDGIRKMPGNCPRKRPTKPFLGIGETTRKQIAGNSTANKAAIKGARRLG
jgi:hypothetical protein